MENIERKDEDSEAGNSEKRSWFQRLRAVFLGPNKIIYHPHNGCYFNPYCMYY
jgi:hypothetical protein